MTDNRLSVEGQFGAQVVLRFLSDLFTVSGKDQFSREDILVLLNVCKHDPELFDADVIAEEEELVASEEQDS